MIKGPCDKRAVFKGPVFKGPVIKRPSSKIMGPTVFRKLLALDTCETVNSAKYGNGQFLVLNTFSTFLPLNTDANRI